MLTNLCFYVFGDAFRVLDFYCTYFHPRLTQCFFINKFFNTILKLIGAYILLLKTTKSK